MAALDTVANYITEARVLLQDQSVPYRYSDADIVQALNFAVSEAVRMRPDLFMRVLRTSGWIPAYSSGVTSTSVTLDNRYRLPALYFIVGQLQLRDDEGTQDARAAGFVQKFSSELTGAK